MSFPIEKFKFRVPFDSDTARKIEARSSEFEAPSLFSKAYVIEPIG